MTNRIVAFTAAALIVLGVAGAVVGIAETVAYLVVVAENLRS